MKSSPLLFTALFAFLFLAASCEKDDPEIPNEEELITTLTYTLTPDGGGIPAVFSFRDLDGDGGNAPIITVEKLAANTVYSGKLELLNEQDSPAESITDEILEEDEDHQFFFQTTATGLTIEYADRDSDNNPIGLQSTLTTNAAGSGTMTIILRHEPNKSATGVAAGSIDNAGGETDIEVTFNVEIQ